MCRELTISSDVPAPKLTKALKTGKLTSYEEALKARKAGRGVRLDITPFKFVKDSGLLSKGLDAAVPALATAFGAPQAGIIARAAIKSLTGVGVYDSASDVEKEGGRIGVF
ncbi:uncharacterized protein PITG_04414 [Phytophthora infestans T30-4]|uniref:Uncharacterized protein n=1 Tax=Phytophthora infestans (strain T30-4) TaxID=403677 RepID=D0N176_PHYIT|nr:uncharacterized protein PITG_04414 [Phytophthora infestans T30-4]EEY67389.1 conserved hypothetical protein [Phytophthora infestans T30-4]|eukprot:XP_002906037.1 conserved hypothetical protein [Phytophthora infestans T30-4]